MAKQVKCPTCKKMNDKDNTIEVSKRYYCIPCGEDLVAKRESRKTDWDVLFNYICEMYRIEKPTMLMFAQLKQFKDNGMTDIGIYHTLRYLHEVVEKNINEEKTLGLVPYYYEQARTHVMRTYDIADMVAEFEFEDKVKTVEVVSLPSRYLPKQPKSLTGIDWGEDEDEDE